MPSMWDVVRQRMGKTSGGGKDKIRPGSPSFDYEDMMELYEEEIDDELQKFEPLAPRSRYAVTSPGGQSVSQQVPFSRQYSTGGIYTQVSRPPLATRVCAYCSKESCMGQCVRQRLDSNVEEDGEMSPMIRERETNSGADRYVNLNRRYETLPFADDSPRSSVRSSHDLAPNSAAIMPGVPPPLPTRPPPQSPQPQSPQPMYSNVCEMSGGQVVDNRAENMQSSMGRTYHPGEGAAPLPLDFSKCDVQVGISPVDEHRKFFKALIKAIKTANTAAVQDMCRSVIEHKVDLSDTKKFTESRYTATALHVALLFKHSRIAEHLITTCPKLVFVPYTNDYLNGQTCFHIAAANNDLNTLELMLRVVEARDGKQGIRNALDTRATGQYFEQSHQEGALCITAALWAGNVDMLDLLLRNQARMDCIGPAGNTPLHHLVFFSDEYPEKQDKVHQMFQLFWEYCDSWLETESGGFTHIEVCYQKAKRNKVQAMRQLLQIRNHDQQTPLTLAVNLQAPIAKYMLNFEPVYRLPQTKFGSTSWVTYDVTDVTSYGSTKRSWTRYNPSSVLHILAHRAKIVSTDDQTFEDLIQIQPIYDLVKMKWSVYRYVYYLWMVVHLFYMIGLTYYGTHYQHIVESLNQTDNDTSSYNATSLPANLTNLSLPVLSRTEDDLSLRDMTSVAFHAPWLFFIVPLFYLIMEIEDIVFVSYRSMKSLSTSRGFKKTIVFLMEQWTVTGNGPFRLTLIGFSFCMLTWAVMVEMAHIDQDIPLSFALGLGWIFMLFFTRGFKPTSRFSIMVQKMFFQDFIYFLSVYSFIWIAFASAMQALVQEDKRLKVGMTGTLYAMLNIVTDAGEKATEHTSRLPNIAAMILSCYAVISVILLLNMLIAMMNASYDAVKMSKTNLFRYQQLSILLMIERRLFWFRTLCHLSQRHLWVPKPTTKDDTDGLTETPKTRGALDEVEIGVIKKQKLTPKRMYMEVTERTFAEDDSIYKPYGTRYQFIKTNQY